MNSSIFANAFFCYFRSTQLADFDLYILKITFNFYKINHTTDTTHHRIGNCTFSLYFVKYSPYRNAFHTKFLDPNEFLYFMLGINYL
jgi:hypothetical protein